MEINSTDYHDYVIKGGKLIGEFEQMYAKSSGIPWHQNEQENWLDVRLTCELLREEGNYERIVDYGCGLGHYLDILVRKMGGGAGYGFDLSETAVRKASDLFPEFRFIQANLMVADNQGLKLPRINGKTLHVIRGTLWYVIPKIDNVVENLLAQLEEYDALMVIQNFPPLNCNFVGKDIIPNPDALIKHFEVGSVHLDSHIWYERTKENSNDSWFIGIFKNKIND